MNRSMSWIALVGTLMIAAALGIAVLGEPGRQITAAANLSSALIAEGTDLYAENCVACHGATGEGIAAYPPLTSAAAMDAQTVFNTIERGRYNTGMAAFGVGRRRHSHRDANSESGDHAASRNMGYGRRARGGTRSDAAADHGRGDSRRNVRAGCSLPDGAALAAGLDRLRRELRGLSWREWRRLNLSARAQHRRTARPSERRRPRPHDHGRRTGNADVVMVRSALDASSSKAVVTLISRWGELNAAGVSLPVIEAAPLDMSPQAVASGQRLFDLLCTQCHGIDGYGSPIAPALNNQTFLSQTPDAAIQAIIAGGVSGTVMPSWSGYLTDADIAAITAYLRSLAATAPIVAPAQP